MSSPTPSPVSASRIRLRTLPLIACAAASLLIGTSSIVQADDSIAQKSGPGPLQPSQGSSEQSAGVDGRLVAGSTEVAGSPEVGSTSYPVPSNAIFVSPSGSDTSTGTAGSPLRTIEAAVSLASAGQTIVLRAGSYHEEVTIPPTKPGLTVQAYPNEAVWLDGSRVLDGFNSSGGDYVLDRWTTEFDSSPTYHWGATDGETPGWAFVSPDHPMAAHPDQVWINGKAQRQVGSRAAVEPGTFYVDYAKDNLILGTDPGGKTVRASTIAKAVSIRAEETTLRGIGIRRYAPSVPHMGAVTAERPGVVLENLAITDMATTGLAIAATGASVTDVTVARNGMLGATATYADGLKVNGLRAVDNNTEHFNTSPVAGGMKIARSRTVEVRNSSFMDNEGTGLWFDESVYDADIVNNRMIGNSRHGISVEISAKARLVDNVIANNGGFGAKINNTSDVAIWNNTFTGNGRSINIVQDDRRASDPNTPGHDPRQEFPDPTMTWITGPVTVRNNIMANTNNNGNCLLCVEDYSHEFSAEEMGVTANGNVYHRSGKTDPRWAVVWSEGPGNPSVFTSVDGFAQATAQADSHLELVGDLPLGESFRPTTVITAKMQDVAIGLPADIAGLAGKEPGTHHLGAFIGE